MTGKYTDTEMIVFHYSIKKPVLGNIVKKSEDEATLELPLKNLKENINIGDPMVIICNVDNGDYQILGCHVTDIFNGTGTIDVKINPELKGENHRLYERLPISICADIKDDERKRRYSGVLKDISKNGLLLCIKDTIPVNSHVEINIIFGNAIVFLKGCIVRMNEKPYCNCYGLHIPNDDVLSMNNLYKFFKLTCEDYMRKLMDEFDIFIKFDRFEHSNTQVKNNAETMLNSTVMKLDDILRQRSRH